MKKINAIWAISILLIACNNNQDESDAFGNFETIETIISSEVNGRVLEFVADEGMILAEGQQTGVIDTLQYTLTLGQLEAKKKAVLAKIPDIEASAEVIEVQMNTLRTELKRIQSMVEENAATQQQLDEIQGKIDVLQSQIKSTKVKKLGIYAEAESISKQIEITMDQLSKCYLKNPLFGTVLETFIEPFEMVFAGKPLYKIADLSEMDLRVYVSGAQLPHVKIGQPVRVYIDEDEDDMLELDGVVSWISSKAEFTPKIIQTKEERVDLVYAVKVRVQNDGRLKIGMPGEVKF